jgi:PadR family transcriptional regulator PadR
MMRGGGATGGAGGGLENGSRQTQRLKGFLDHILLALIAERPRYGFELKEILEEALPDLTVADGSIYPLLARLREQGLVTSRMARSTETGRERRYYEILPQGRERLAAWERQWERFREAMDSLTVDRAR